MKENEKCVCAISMRLYKYMGRYSPKESKNRHKSEEIFVDMSCFDNSVLQKLCFRMLRKYCPKCEHQEGKREGSLEVALSRTRSARIPTVMLFFCCHKCHTRTKIVEKRLKNLLEKVMRSVFFLVVYCVFRGTESMKY